MSDVKWVKFKDREGPVVHGSIEYSCPEMPSEDERILSIVAKAEGGRFDAVNMYDRGIVSIGLLQWAEHVGKVSRFFGYAMERGAASPLTKIFQPMFDRTGVGLQTFQEGKHSRWRFSFQGSPVMTPESLQATFLGCDGVSSSWNDERRSMAIEWARTFHQALIVTRDYMQVYACQDMHGFVTPLVKSALFRTFTSETNALRASRALYIAMAVNSPGGAQKAFVAVSNDKNVQLASVDWCQNFFNTLKQPNGEVPKQFANRYVRVKSLVESMYNVTLP